MLSWYDFDPPHIRGRLNAWNVLERDVPDATQCDDSAGSVLPPLVAHGDAAHEEVKDAAADEGEHEGGISCHLGGDLELYSRSKQADRRKRDDRQSLPRRPVARGT